MMGPTLFERIVSVTVTITVYLFFLIGTIVLLAGCGEETPASPRILDVVPPRIIAVDPAPAKLSDDWLKYRQLPEDQPVLYLPFHGTRDMRIELTFSYPPADLSANKQFWFNADDARKVHFHIFYCSTGSSSSTYPHLFDLDALYVTWKGGGQQFVLWCQEVEE